MYLKPYVLIYETLTWIQIGLLTIVLLIVSSCSWVAITYQGGLQMSGFVTRSDRTFMLDGAPFRFVGANMYNAACEPSVYGCGPWMNNPDVELDDWFTRARRDFGAQVIRFWAYQSYTAGGTNWQAFDRVMRLANKHALKVIPVLENQWEACTQGGDKYDSWYAGGYAQPYGNYPISYREYVSRIVNRYKNEPAVAAWMLMNEAESKSTSGTPNPDALYTFARDMSEFVKSIDTNHLVTLGLLGGNQAGLAGSYGKLHSISTIDFADFHDYGFDDEALPGLPLVYTVPVSTSIFTLDQNYSWNQQSYRQNKPRTWEVWTGTIPSGVQPFQRIGAFLVTEYVGDVYIDQIKIGSKVYDFEDGTTQGWQIEGPASLTNASGHSLDGSRALKLAISAPGNVLVWIPATSSDILGTAISLEVYVDTPGTLTDGTLAANMEITKKLNKPFLVGEAGMATCGPYPGLQPETPDSRAQKFDAKIKAFFDNGGAGYLIWTWDPGSGCLHDFTTGDPLNAVLTKYAATFSPPASLNGLKGQYYDNKDLTNLKLTRTDATVNFNWNNGSPDAMIGSDTFSVRWTGQVQPRYSEIYTFYTVSDDGVRLWVNNQLIINNWTDHPPTENRGEISLVAGQKYDMKMEFYENGGGAAAKLLWSSPTQSKEVIPQSQLFSMKST